ncbi:sugar phosphate isomerase/epimerase family protein [Saccharopolyspora griseoalba]|uniref:Sugar phosphate isomerase/epimerase family protein n=1 Tax=Saccharopolyspora griseoalba TaxID=1431848 RepID=A0ABW2LQW3_9PSEU
MSWKLAFSTLGMPGAPLREAVSVATAHGCHGLELRAHPDEEVRLGIDPGPARRRVEDDGLQVACLAGYAKICHPGPDRPVVDELRSLIELAAGLGTPSIRVFPGGRPAEDGPAVERIGAVVEDLRASGVRLLLETHDSHPTGELARRVVEPFADPGVVAVLWDALHPWRHGEPPERTRAELAEFLGHFQIKDAAGPADTTPLPPGEGGVPLTECARLLQTWSGWVSLEWEKAWYPGIPRVEAALPATTAWFRTWNPG